VLDHQVQNRDIRGTAAASSRTRSNAGRHEEWCETHVIDVGVGALSQ
jgi:hypothetical protein